jgi:hypothetical protein
VDAAEHEEGMPALLSWPERGGREVVSRTIGISRESRERLRALSQTRQVVPDPVIEIKWLDPAVGREWIADGNALVRDLQREIGPVVRVVGDFAAYDPDVKPER